MTGKHKATQVLLLLPLSIFDPEMKLGLGEMMSWKGEASEPLHHC